MDSLDGFQSERERKEVDRKAEEEKKVKVGIVIKIFGLRRLFLSNFWIEMTELCLFFVRLLNMTAILKG